MLAEENRWELFNELNVCLSDSYAMQQQQQSIERDSGTETE